MNVQSMQKGAQQQLNAMDVPIVSEDIVHYLNRAEEKFIDEQYVLLRGKYTDNNSPELYEGAQQAIENLRTLVTTEVVGNADINTVSYFDNAKSYDLTNLTDDFYFYVRSQTQLESGGQWVNNKLVEEENVQKFIKTKYNSPMFRDFLVLLEGDLMYIFYDSQSDVDVYDVALTYVKKPAELVLNDPSSQQTTVSELPIHTHQDIIDIAVSMIMRDKAGNNPRLQKEGDS